MYVYIPLEKSKKLASKIKMTKEIDRNLQQDTVITKVCYISHPKLHVSIEKSDSLKVFCELTE